MTKASSEVYQKPPAESGEDIKMYSIVPKDDESNTGYGRHDGNLMQVCLLRPDLKVRDSEDESSKSGSSEASEMSSKSSSESD